jgi:TRAP-type C4-dicarboxylate transport system substrate-binding protein
VRRSIAVTIVAAAAVWSARAQADVVIRIASPAPEGTAWARAGRAIANELESTTSGRVKLKTFLGGITGNEIETADRIRRGQLDAIASGGMICMKVMPSFRILRIVGLFQSRDESSYVSGRLRRTFEAEARREGFVLLGDMGVGPDHTFSTTPIASLADLKKPKFWVWDLDDVYSLEMPALGISMNPAPLERASRAFDEGKINGFVAVPTAALAFQWSTQSRYVSDLRLGFLRGCILVSTRVFDALDVGEQQALRASIAKLVAQLEDIGRRQDEALIGGLFERQGVRVVRASESFRAEFFEAARQARDKLGAKLVDPALLQKVMSMLADYRAEHAAGAPGIEARGHGGVTPSSPSTSSTRPPPRVIR